MQTLIEKFATDLGFIAPVSAFLKQRVINAVEEELNQEAPVTKEIPSPPDRSSSAFASTASDEEPKAKQLRRKRHDQKFRRHSSRSV